jgi:hypothetical protein
MLEQYKKTMLGINKIMSDLSNERQGILASGKSKEWMQARLAEVAKKAEDELQKWNKELKFIADEYVIAGESFVYDARKQPAKGEPVDPATLDLHRGLAKDTFNGLTPEEILTAFDQVVGELSESELGLKWIYENTVKNMIREPAYTQAVDEALDKHRTSYEKATRRELERRQRFMDHDSTIRGLAEQDVASIIRGEQPLYNDYGILYDEVMSNLDATTD